MVQINFALKEVNCKIVYYGPGMSGKTTNLEIVHQKAPEDNKGELTSISTDGDRTLFFDFMPLDLGMVAGMRTKFQLYTVPGQVYYNSTRKLVLQGVDGVIFVSDSDPDKMRENIESYENLIENLREYGKDIREMPHVIQYNKRDLPNAMPRDEMDRQLNRFNVPVFEAVAMTGEGVFPTLKVLAGLVLESIDRMDSRRAPPKAAAGAPKAAPAKPAAGAPRATAAAAPAGTEARGQGARAKSAAAPPAGGKVRSAATGKAAAAASSRKTADGAAAPRTGRPRSQQTASSATAESAAPSPAKRGMALAVGLTLFLAVAVAGAVFFFMQQQG